MSKRFFYTIFFSFVLLLANFITAPSNAKGVEVWKSETNQSIKRGKWTTLKFGNKTSMDPKGSRSFYCAQVHLKLPSKKPKWVKIRFARILPNGKLDSTGTNTWTLGSKSPASWQGSTCWPINPDYPVVAQVKYGGGPKSITSPLRQFKLWNPGTEVDDTLFIFN